MRRSQSSSEHAEAVSRRLATLSAELAAVRHEPDASTHTRVRPSEEPPPAPVVLPVPGRHASRRLRIGPLRLGPVHLAVVAVVAAVAVGLAAWWAVRDQAQAVPLAPVEPAASPLTGLTDTEASSSTSSAPSPSGTAAPSGDLVVDVAGKVRRPGIAVLPAGSRVVDALKSAGGARNGVDLTTLNLARPLVDGEQILVGVAPAAGVAGSLGSPTPPGGTLVNLNTADQPTLETLPGVGPVTAEAILAWRTDNGGFSSVDELLEVDGIGEATLADLAPLVTL
jgi:competence protein ComEA